MERSEVSIAGPAGTIELVCDLQTNARANFVMCHPHSLHGGTMTNKVVTTAVKAAQNQVMNTLCFNFRGVGQSEGVFDHGQGEQDDLATVVRWLQAQAPNLPLILAGFSFGSFVAASCSDRLKAQACISIAPPVERFDFSTIARGSFHWYVLQGTADEVVDFNQVVDWFSSIDQPKSWFEFDACSHFFHGQLIPLRHHLETILNQSVDTP